MMDRYEFHLQSKPPSEELDIRRQRLETFEAMKQTLEEENSFLDSRRVEYRMNLRFLEMLHDKIGYYKTRAQVLGQMLGEEAPSNETSVSVNRTTFKLVNPKFRMKANGFGHLVDADAYPAEVTRIVLAPEGNRVKIWGSPVLGGSLLNVSSEDLDIVEDILPVDEHSGEYVAFLTTEDWVDLASLVE